MKMKKKKLCDERDTCNLSDVHRIPPFSDR